MNEIKVGNIIKTNYTSWWDDATDNPVIIPSSFGIVTAIGGEFVGVTLWLDENSKYITKLRHHVHHCSELRLVCTNKSKVEE